MVCTRPTIKFLFLFLGRSISHKVYFPFKKYLILYLLNARDLALNPNQLTNYCKSSQLHCLWFRFMVFNATFNNISDISWRSVLLVEETGVPGENHRHVPSHWQTYHKMLYRVHRLCVQIHTCISSENKLAPLVLLIHVIRLKVCRSWTLTTLSETKEVIITMLKQKS
jgi:hypothetical protein